MEVKKILSEIQKEMDKASQARNAEASDETDVNPENLFDMIDDILGDLEPESINALLAASVTSWTSMTMATLEGISRILVDKGIATKQELMDAQKQAHEELIETFTKLGISEHLF